MDGIFAGNSPQKQRNVFWRNTCKDTWFLEKTRWYRLFKDVEDYSTSFLHSSEWARMVSRDSPSWMKTAAMRAVSCGVWQLAMLQAREETRVTSSQEFIIFTSEYPMRKKRKWWKGTSLIENTNKSKRNGRDKEVAGILSMVLGLRQTG